MSCSLWLRCERIHCFPRIIHFCKAISSDMFRFSSVVMYSVRIFFKNCGELIHDSPPCIPRVQQPTIVINELKTLVISPVPGPKSFNSPPERDRNLTVTNNSGPVMTRSSEQVLYLVVIRKSLVSNPRDFYINRGSEDPALPAS